MRTRTGTYLADERRRRHLTPQQLAAAVGYRNVGHGANRILDLEQGAVVVNDLLKRVVAAMNLGAAYVRQLEEEDRREFRREWDRWADTPVKPALIRRVIPAVYVRVPLPDGLSKADAVEHARAHAVKTRHRYALVWSRRETIWFDEHGSTHTTMAEPGRINEPRMTLRGERRPFAFSGSRTISWPGDRRRGGGHAGLAHEGGASAAVPRRRSLAGSGSGS